MSLVYRHKLLNAVVYPLCGSPVVPFTPCQVPFPDSTTMHSLLSCLHLWPFFFYYLFCLLCPRFFSFVKDVDGVQCVWRRLSRNFRATSWQRV